MKIVVIKTFRDKYNPDKIFNPGEIVSGFDDGRARDLVLRGLAAAVKEVDGGSPPETSPPAHGHGDSDAPPAQDAAGREDNAAQNIDLKESHIKVIAAVQEFADAEKLKGYLAEESASIKPRASVVDAIKARIAELETASGT
ncbi:MAG: hypothetical protein LBP50_03225 [Tannerella sp.]|jgi:hypothetical protein|nr:hypothetical protein [Tannerella sp.]